jgi:hypothetical protein
MKTNRGRHLPGGETKGKLNMTPEDQAFECPRCQIGVCQASKATYTRMFHGQLISVPDMTIYTCDVCGYYELDGDTVYDLEAMMGTARRVSTEEQRPKSKATLQTDMPKSTRFKP